MLQVARWRIVFVAIVTLLGVVFALPNLLPPAALRAMPDFVRNSTINLGLDLRGGSYLLLEIDSATLERQRLEQVSDLMASALRDAEPRITYSGRGVVAGAARVRLTNPADAPRALQALRAIAAPINQNALGGGEPELVFTQGADGLIEARVTPQALEQLARQGVQQSIEIIRRRVDPSGVSEVSITRQGADRIVLQAPGDSDPEALRRRIGQTARLTFHEVDLNADPVAAAEGRLPQSRQFLPYADPQRGAGVVIMRRPKLTGEMLNDALPSFDAQTNEPVVTFRFNSEGARIFGRFTSENVGRPFAVVLDDRVLTDPVINEPILGGTGQISGNFTPESANELAVLLRAGALPAPLEVIEQRAIGPELGQDAIEAGAISTVIAFVLVLVFMVLAYGFLFGGISVIALLLNGVLIFAAMSAFGAALTLPGVAGLILTLAVALDANVLIYERMRDEVRAGRSPVLAAEAGFSRAIVTIFDANITHLGAALIMLALAPAGPVKGFAWTLTIGVFTSVFTAVLITQLLLAWWFRSTRPKRLPIS